MKLITHFLMMLTFASVALASDQPNIVWIVTEDNSPEYLRLYEPEHGAAMPNVERLAKDGLVFDHAFSNAPVCSVARSTIISSCYAPRLMAQYHRKMQPVPMPEGLHMFPWYLRKAGYYTTNNAKEDYNLIKGDDVWDESSTKASFRNRAQGQPFFHVQNFDTTHEGHLHFSKEVVENHPTLTDPEGIPVQPCHPDTALFRYTNAYYRDLHMQVDREIGEFLKTLEEDGLLDDTIIFYYGDHGGVLPGSKGYIYERGVQVPLVVYIPEKWKHLAPVGTGNRVDGFVQFVDLGPTVLNLASANIPQGIDGKPFLGKGISIDELNARDYTYSYADRFDEKSDFVRAVHKGKFKYMRNFFPFNHDGLFNFYRFKQLAYQELQQMHDAGKLSEPEDQFFTTKAPEALYDLEKDPYELVNLAKNPEYVSKLTELRDLLNHQILSMPDLSFYPESYLIEVASSNPTAFGKSHSEEIQALLRIANLSLLDFDTAKPGIEKAIQSKNPWERYWAWVVCAALGESAREFTSEAMQAGATDANNLVRLRAAEFLALNGNPESPNLLRQCIQQADTEAEVTLILNAVALIQYRYPAMRFAIERSWFKKEWLEKPLGYFEKRIDYINSLGN